MPSLQPAMDSGSSSGGRFALGVWWEHEEASSGLGDGGCWRERREGHSRQGSLAMLQQLGGRARSQSQACMDCEVHTSLSRVSGKSQSRTCPTEK
eukprot:2799549-Rhodomonas_salina.1